MTNSKIPAHREIREEGSVDEDEIQSNYAAFEEFQ